MAELQLLLVEVGAVRCALRREYVRELLPLPHLVAQPGAPRILAGFLNLGGEAVPVLRLARILDFAAAEGPAAGSLYHHLVLIDGVLQGSRAALLVDRALSLLKLDEGTLTAAGTDTSMNDCVEAQVPLPDGFAHLLAVDRILLAAEKQGLAELRDTAQARLAEWAA